jgi:hypothetical protein
MKNLSNLVFIIFSSTSHLKILSHSLEILSHEDYQEEIDALYIIPQHRKMQFMEAIKELGGRLKYRLHST